jgi:dihydropteroate synthase
MFISAVPAMSPVQIMTILNATPDSFSDGGRLNTESALLKAAEKAILAGTDILDIGGESTRPGSQQVALPEEIDRVIPAIEAILKEFPQTRISIDTRKSSVAKAALQSGAQIVNDVSGLQYDPAMADICAQAGCELILMHSQGTPDTMQQAPSYPGGVIQDVFEFFERQVSLAVQAGVNRHQIILDPGFGFGKNLEHNLTLLSQLAAFKPLGLPLLAGTSRKSFLTLGDQTIVPARREALTAVSLAMAVERGATFIRIHDPVTQIPCIRLVEATLKALPIH